MGANGEFRKALDDKKGNPRDEDYPDYSERLQMALHRVPEELYDTLRDPGCLHNLAANPEHHATIQTLRNEMLALLESTADQELNNYRLLLR